MLNTKRNFIVRAFVSACLLVFSFSIVQSASAQSLVPCGIGVGSADCTLCHLVLGFKNIYDYLLEIILVATTTVIVISGVMYMVSSGNKGMIDKAKSALTYALTAMVLALTAWLIINTTLNALGYNKSGSWWNFSCDTAQTTGAGTTGPRGATLPAVSPNGGGISGKGRDIQVPQDGSKLAQALEKYKGAVYVNYNWNPNGTKGWVNGVFYGDCSSFTQAIWKEVYGVDIPRHSGDQKSEAFNASSIVNGTILVSNGHVGVYYGGSVYHNSGTDRDVRVVELNQYLSNHNIIGMRRPSA